MKAETAIVVWHQAMASTHAPSRSHLFERLRKAPADVLLDLLLKSGTCVTRRQELPSIEGESGTIMVARSWESGRLNHVLELGVWWKQSRCIVDRLNSYEWMEIERLPSRYRVSLKSAGGSINFESRGTQRGILMRWNGDPPVFIPSVEDSLPHPTATKHRRSSRPCLWDEDDIPWNEWMSGLEDPNPSVRRSTATQLGRAHVEYELSDELKKTLESHVIPLLIHATKDPVAGVREAATKALGELWESALVTVDPIVKMTRDSSDSVRLAAIRSLKSSCFAAILLERFELLQHLLTDANAEIRLESIQLVTSICQSVVPRTASPAKRRLFKKQKQAFRQYIIKDLKFCLGEIDLRCRAAAVQGLIAAVPDTQEFANLMGSILREETAIEIQDPIIRWLGKSRRKPNPSIPLFVDALPHLPIQALQALEACGSDVIPQLPNLFPLLRDRRWEVRYHAMLVLKAIGPDARDEIIPAVTMMLKDREFTIRQEVANVLKVMQCDSDSANSTDSRPERRRKESASPDQ